MTNLVEVAGLCKRYDSFTLDHIDLTVPEGQIVGLIGENGAGKTTTIKSILGVVRPDGGTIRLMGKPSGDKGALEKVGVVFEGQLFQRRPDPLPDRPDPPGDPPGLGQRQVPAGL